MSINVTYQPYKRNKLSTYPIFGFEKTININKPKKEIPISKVLYKVLDEYENNGVDFCKCKSCRRLIIKDSESKIPKFYLIEGEDLKKKTKDYIINNNNIIDNILNDIIAKLNSNPSIYCDVSGYELDLISA